MTSGRVSTKDAIEILRSCYHARRENPVPTENDRGLEEKNINKQNQLDTIQQDVSDLRHENERMNQTMCGQESNISQLESGLANHTDQIQRLHNSHQALRDDFSKCNVACEVKNLQYENTLTNLAAEIARLESLIGVSGQAYLNEVEDLRSDLASKVEKKIVDELEDKVEVFTREIDERFETLRQITHVTDSFPSLHNQRSGRHESLPNTSVSISLLSQPPREDDLRPSQWKPLSTQTASQALPPTMPETLFITHRQGEALIQTSSPRLTAPTQGMTSNMVHSGPALKGNLVGGLQPTNVPPVSAQPLRQERRTTKTVLQDDETSRDVLNDLLWLRQQEDETLVQYFERYQTIVPYLSSDYDVVSACLRRLLNGVTRSEDKQFVQDWLMASDWDMENARDCVLLMTRFHSDSSVTRSQHSLEELRDTSAPSDEVLNTDHGIHQPSPLRSGEKEVSCSTALPEDQVNSRESVPQQVEPRGEMPPPARLVKTRKTRKATGSTRRQKKAASTSHHRQDTEGQQDMTEKHGHAAGTNVATDENRVNEREEAGASAAAKKKSYRSRIEKELRSLMDMHAIEKNVPKLVTPQKRKVLHESDSHVLPEGWNAPNIEDSPLAKRRGNVKHNTRFAAHEASKLTVVPRTGDAMSRPHIVPELAGNGEREEEKITSGVGYRIRDALDVPVLDLNSSDFEG